MNDQKTPINPRGVHGLDKFTKFGQTNPKRSKKIGWVNMVFKNKNSFKIIRLHVKPYSTHKTHSTHKNSTTLLDFFV